jgi:outer membrane protein assembly factor BamE
MTRRQVSLIMGTPSIQDPFHQNRWDYAASYQQRGGDIEIKSLTLYFDDNVLAKWKATTSRSARKTSSDRCARARARTRGAGAGARVREDKELSQQHRRAGCGW